MSAFIIVLSIALMCSGGDWSLHRGGSVFLEGTEHVTVNGCTFRRVDGNALFFSG